MAKKLNLERVKGKNGGFLNTSILIRILKNPLYVKSDESSHKYLESTGMNVFGTPNGNGYITYNKTKKIIIDRHITEWIVAVSKHKGIIESSHWIKVQKLLENNKDKKVIRLGTGSKNTSILTGILKCEKCGGNMVIRHGHKEANTGKRFAYYICSNKDSRFVDKCTNPNIRVDKLDSIIISQIKAFKIHLLKESLEKVLLEASSQFKSDYYEKIQKEITEKNKAISNLVLTLSQCPNEDVTRLIMKQITSFNSEINELESSLETNHANNSKAQLKIKNLQFVIDSIEKFNSNINLIDDVNEKRLLIQTITKEILWNGNTYTAKVIINGLNHHY